MAERVPPVATLSYSGAIVADWWGLADKHRSSPAGFIAALVRTRQEIGLQRVSFGTDCPRRAGATPLSERVGAFRTVPPLAAKHGTEVSGALATALARNTMRLPCIVAET